MRCCWDLAHAWTENRTMLLSTTTRVLSSTTMGQSYYPQQWDNLIIHNGTFLLSTTMVILKNGTILLSTTTGQSYYPQQQDNLIIHNNRTILLSTTTGQSCYPQQQDNLIILNNRAGTIVFPQQHSSVEVSY